MVTEKGDEIQEVSHSTPPHSGFCRVFREGETQAHRITVIKIPEIILWIIYSFSLSLSY